MSLQHWDVVRETFLLVFKVRVNKQIEVTAMVSTIKQQQSSAFYRRTRRMKSQGLSEQEVVPSDHLADVDTERVDALPNATQLVVTKLGCEAPGLWALEPRP